MNSIEGYYLGAIPGRNEGTLYKVVKTRGIIATIAGISTFYEIHIIRDEKRPERIGIKTRVVPEEINKALLKGVFKTYEPTKAEKILYGL